MKRSVLFLVLLVGAAVPLCAQERPAFASDTPDRPLGIVDTIIVSGNHKTKDYVILDEMTTHVGSVATVNGLEYDRSRIYSLGLFTRVDIFYDSLGTTRFLFVDVNERWYLIPFPIFGFREGDIKKVYFGGSFLHNNFRGRNQKLHITATLGYEPSASFSFADPQISREHNLFFSTGISAARLRNRSVAEADSTGNFDEHHYDLGVTLGKRLDLYQTLSISPGFHVVDLTDYRPGRTVSAKGRDRYLYLSLSYSYDSRDLREYAMRGAYASAYVTQSGFGESAVGFTRYGLDLRKYTPLPGGFSFASRVHGSLVSGGLVPTYARAYFGYNERIRGYGRQVMEGDNLAGANVELRYPILPARTIIFRALPLPEQFAVWRFGVSLALFADTGLAWFRGQPVAVNEFWSGYGGGIHFLLPYGYVARVEYAINNFGHGEFVLDLEASI